MERPVSSPISSAVLLSVIRKLVARDRFFSFSRSRKNALHFGHIRAAGALPEIFFHPESRQFLGDGDVYKLVEGDSFTFRHFPRFFQQ